MEVDTWVGPSGKNGMRRDWLIRSRLTGRVFCRATRYARCPPLSVSVSISIGFSFIGLFDGSSPVVALG